MVVSYFGLNVIAN